MAPLSNETSAHVLTQKSWPDLLDHVRYWRSRSRQAFANNNWSQTTVVAATNSPDGCVRARVYGLGSPAKSVDNENLTAHQTLLCADVQLAAEKAPGELAGGTCLAEVRWRELLDDDEEQRERRPLSKEEEALHERLRASVVSGVTNYTLDTDSKHILFTSASRLFTCYDSSCESILKPVRLPLLLPSGGAPLDAQPCPDDLSLLACVCSNDIFLFSDNATIRATFTADSLPGCALSAGTPSFVMQEEFDRYTAMWWAPKNTTDDSRLLLYEQVDDTNVVELSLSAPGTLHDLAETMRYPLAGTDNALSTLKMLQVQNAPKEDGGLMVADLCLSVDLRLQFPWFEYLIRAGWTSDGRAIWAQLLSRRQDHLALIYIPRSLFIDPKTDNQTAGAVLVLYEEINAIWINAHNLTHFLSTDSPNRIRFICSSEKHGFSHLYLLDVNVENDTATTVSEVPITAGQWPVIRNSGLVADEKRGHVYFVAHKNSPIETSVCVASYELPGECRPLTPLGKSFRSDRVDQRLHVQPDVGFVCWLSSLAEPPICVFYRLIHSSISGSLPVAVPVCRLASPQPRPVCPLGPFPQDDVIDRVDEVPMEEEEEPSEFKSMVKVPDTAYEEDLAPEVISYTSANSGQTHYAMLMRPHNWQPHRTYPVLHYVYAGPGTQLVRNVWSSWGGFQKYTSLGYAVVMVDGRGSTNRGLEFEGAMKYRMGSIEMADQVEGLLAVAAQTDSLLDLNRVAMFGWSYGGYVSLLALAQRPDVYKVCVAGGPVSSWLLYDTAYTERYMGLPREQTAAYGMASNVVQQAIRFPAEPDRLLILHGLIDENVHFRHTEKLIEALIKAGKPYRLQVFPRERHGVRGNEANELMDATVLHFIAGRLAGQ